MKILKFGGTSLADAVMMNAVCNIITEQMRHEAVGVVLSAVAGVTSHLIKSIEAAINGQAFQSQVHDIERTHCEIISALTAQYHAFPQMSLIDFVTATCRQHDTLLQGVQLLGECPERIYCQILSFGEKLSAQIMLELLHVRGIDATFLDAADVIKTRGSLAQGTPMLEKITACFKPFREHSCLLMSGFIGSDLSGHASLLGRDGSDYSASIMAVALSASTCEIWTDVDGIYTVDPRQVSDAQLIPQMSYGEAMELAFYGANVLHPKTTATLVSAGIPLYIKNTRKPEQTGTKICAQPVVDASAPIRAVSCIRNIVLINIDGAGMKGASGIAARVFDAVAKSGASIVLISQASSECSICFAIRKQGSQQVLETLHALLALELQTNIIENISAVENQAIVCIVGDNMRMRYGIAGKFFNALAHAAVNIVAIAQGSLERCISVVVDAEQVDRAVHATHRAFFNALQPIELYLIGVGSVGSELLAQIHAQQQELLENNVEIKVCLIANSGKYLHDSHGIDLANWRQQLDGATRGSNMDDMLQQAALDKPLNGILVDCTSSEQVGSHYQCAFNAGLHVVAANKKANSSTWENYHALRTVADKNKRLFLYETNVGAGLPTIDTFKSLIKSGDHLLEFSGILSGSLSFIFGALDEGLAFSEAVSIACEKKFTEPDPRDDLSGMDVARKVLILARETGMRCELEDIIMEKIFPEDFDSTGSVSNFLANLKKIDSYFAEKIRTLQAAGKVLRFIGTIDDRQCRVGIRAVDRQHPLYAIKNGENAFAFLTKRYSPLPFVVRGYGAGVGVTASGLFADILKTVNIN